MKRQEWLNKIKNGEILTEEEFRSIENIVNDNYIRFSQLYLFLNYYKSKKKKKHNKVLISAPFALAIADMLEAENYKIYKTRFDEGKSDLYCKDFYVDEYVFDRKRKGKYDLIVLDPFVSKKPLNRNVSLDPFDEEDFLQEDNIINLFEKNLDDEGELILFDIYSIISSSKRNLIAEDKPPRFSAIDIPFFLQNLYYKFQKIPLYKEFKNYFKPFIRSIYSLKRSRFVSGRPLFNNQFYLISKGIHYNLDLTTISKLGDDYSYILEKSKLDSEDFWSPNKYLTKNDQYGFQENHGLTKLSKFSEFFQGNHWLSRLTELEIIDERILFQEDIDDSRKFNSNDYQIINDFDVIANAIEIINGNEPNKQKLSFCSEVVKFDFDMFLKKSLDEFYSQNFFEFEKDIESKNIIKIEGEEIEEKDYLIQKGDICITIDGEFAIMIGDVNSKYLLGPNLIAIRSEYNNFLIDLFYSNNRNNIFSYYFKKENIHDSREFLFDFLNEIEVPIFNDINDLELILSKSESDDYKSKLEGYLYFNFFKSCGWKIETDHISNKNDFYYLSVNDKRISYLILTDHLREPDILNNVPEIDFIKSNKGFICNQEGSVYLYFNSKLTPTNTGSILSPNDLFPGEYPEIITNQTQVYGNEQLSYIVNKISQIVKTTNSTNQIVSTIDKNISILFEIEKLKLNNKHDENEDEIIEKILKLIDSKIEFEQKQKYTDLVKKWFKFWEKLEPQSQEFMSQSEFLYNSIESSKFADYSPFILYYCRVLEFELLNKVFLSFHQYVKESFPEIESLFKYNPEEVNKDTLKDIESGQMASFKRKFKDPKYTLGDMRLILDLLPNKKKPEGSKRFQALPALQELYKYINQSIGSIKSDVIKDIGSIIKEYRNPSAHVGVIDKTKADQFYKLYKTTMNSMFNSFH